MGSKCFVCEFPFTLFMKWVFFDVHWGWTAGFLNPFSHTLTKVRRDWWMSSLLFLTRFFLRCVFHLRVCSESLLRPPSWRSWKRLWTAGCWTCRSTRQTLTPSQVSSQISSNLLPWQPDYLKGKQWLLIQVCFWVVLHGDIFFSACCCRLLSSKQNSKI